MRKRQQKKDEKNILKGKKKPKLYPYQIMATCCKKIIGRYPIRRIWSDNIIVRFDWWIDEKTYTLGAYGRKKIGKTVPLCPSCNGRGKIVIKDRKNKV